MMVRPEPPAKASHSPHGISRFATFHRFLVLGVVAAFGSANQAMASGIDRDVVEQNYVLSPASRDILPSGIYATHGTVGEVSNLARGGPAKLSGAGSFVTLDYGREVGGYISFDVGPVSGSSQSIALSFSESSLFAGTDSDQSMIAGHDDGAFQIAVPSAGHYVMPISRLRGGFRYLTINLMAPGSIEIRNVVLHFTADPANETLRKYRNFFFCSDDLLNRIWYAGAYTVQMDTIDPTQGHSFTDPGPVGSWSNDVTIGTGRSVIVDGGKRDRLIWTGDFGISASTAMASRYDRDAVKNTLDNIFTLQDPVTGLLPFAGQPVDAFISPTYPLWTIHAAAQYQAYARDNGWLAKAWPRIKAALSYYQGQIGSDGVFNAPASLFIDWGRDVSSVGKTLAPNALLYGVLNEAAGMARALNDEAQARQYEANASSLRAAITRVFWDNAAGQFRDSAGSVLYPQDGNSLAVWLGAADTTQAARIVGKLTKNWNSYGALTPERAGSISTFPGSMEVQAHFQAGDDAAGLELIRRQWGYMLSSPISTHSTFWEGYLSDGSFGYGKPYMSHAHGWATGPTFALTNYVLGLTPDAGGGNADYGFRPHPGDLDFAAGSIAIGGQDVVVEWHSARLKHSFTAFVQAPPTLRADIALPKAATLRSIRLDGRLLWNADGYAAPGVHDDGSVIHLPVQKGAYFLQENVNW